MEYTTLTLARNGAIATVTLHRPEVLHALNARTFDELEHVFSALKADPAIRVILLTGSGERALRGGCGHPRIAGYRRRQRPVPSPNAGMKSSPASAVAASL